VDKYAPNVRVSDGDMQSIRDEMAAPLPPIRRPKASNGKRTAA
jgi:hypothetical protein